MMSRLKVFLATREDAWLYRGQMTLVVDGYNNDPRELVDIPEVRTLLRGLESSWPQWAYFFNQVDDSIKLLLSCVAGSRFLGRGAVEMDTAFRQIDPTMDTGSDFSAEFKAATEMQSK